METGLDIMLIIIPRDCYPPFKVFISHHLGLVHILSSLLAAIGRRIADPGDSVTPSVLQDRYLAIYQANEARDGGNKAIIGGLLRLR